MQNLRKYMYTGIYMYTPRGNVKLNAVPSLSRHGNVPRVTEWECDRLREMGYRFVAQVKVSAYAFFSPFSRPPLPRLLAGGARTAIVRCSIQLVPRGRAGIRDRGQQPGTFSY